MAYPLWIKNLKKRAAAIKRKKTANSKKYWIKKAIRESGYAYKINQPKRIVKGAKKTRIRGKGPYIKRAPPSIQSVMQPTWGVTPKWVRELATANVAPDPEGKAWGNVVVPELPDELRWNIPTESKAAVVDDWHAPPAEGGWGS